MNVRCIHCGQDFCPCDDALDLIAEGFISSDSVNCCDDCMDLIQMAQIEIDTFSDADPGLWWDGAQEDDFLPGFILTLKKNLTNITPTSIFIS